jgi:hypothetical protein
MLPMFRSTSLGIYASNEEAPASVRNPSTPSVPVNNAIHRKISELERNLVAKTNIIHKAKVLYKLGNASLIGKGKQEKVSNLIF